MEAGITGIAKPRLIGFGILDRYVLRLWAVPFLIMFIAVNAVFLIQKVTLWLPKLIEHEAPLSLTLTLFVSLMPMDMVMTIPIAYFFALIKLVHDLQSSSELDAMYAGGRSLFNIFAPVLWAGVGLTLVLLVLNMELAPAGRVASHNTVQKLSVLQASPEFAPRQFVRDMDGLTIYYDGKLEDGSYARFMLVDARENPESPVVYVAKKAVLSAVTQGLAIHLQSGTQLMGEKDAMQAVTFTNYDIVIPMQEGMAVYSQAKMNTQPQYMDTQALYRSVESSAQYSAHWHFRLVRSFSVILLFFFAIAISMKAKRSRQGSVFLWAILIMWGINQAEALVFKKAEWGVLPWWSLWLVWGVFMAVALWMFYSIYQRGSIRWPSLRRSALFLRGKHEF